MPSFHFLPSENSDPKTDLEYYKAVGAATSLPMFVQAVGNMSVDLLVDMYKAIPTFRYVKDEAGSAFDERRAAS